MSFKEFPFLDSEEFAEVCHHFDSQYCRATLGPLRQRWKLRLCTALDTSFATGVEYTTYLQVTRPLEATLDYGDLSSCLDKFTFREGEDIGLDDEAMVDAEESDEAALSKPRVPDAGHVVYEVHLHPTYRMPCLWFTLHGLPSDEPAFNLDTVFRRLVPDQFKDALRKTGGIGGISGDHHPVTGLPSFFIHPCLLGDAMSGFDCSKEQYMMLWLGLVGGCVGLWVPKEMAIDMSG
ncbi:autophagy-related protein [Colletotrichum truncatum]|uniref:Autophagy-related protein n=1 Tax=Colletotrichum truncatum TaxID=5467 RepID=A0ACC3Z5F4_COLTU|nr:autophagy-related protein [Colletotrichum truncatum]KAF6795207.1 autophagy-related protein [Colletotrichum truncatum]